MRRPHLLLIAFFFPPSRASGVFRARAIANHYVEHGWDVTVITADRDYFLHHVGSADADLETSIHDLVKIERVAFRSSWWQPDIAQHSWLRASFPNQYAKWLGRFERLRFPEQYASWIPGVIERARSVQTDRPLDLILATGNPFASFQSARLLSDKLRIPYVLDFRDAWSLDQFTGDSAHPRWSPVSRAEKRLISGAELVTFVNEPQADYYAELYPHASSKMMVVSNGYDPEFLPKLQLATSSLRRSQLTFGYVGTITRHVPVEAFRQGWLVARTLTDRIDGAEVALYGHLGFFPTDRPRVTDAMATDGVPGFSYRGSVPKQGLGDVYSNIEVLLALIPPSKYISAGKIYEYMATGKPILAIVAPDSDAASVLTGYPGATVVSPDEPIRIAQALISIVEIAEAWSSHDVQASLSYAQRYERSRLLDPLLKKTRQLVNV